MAIVRWDPARELDVLQSDMNRLFDTFFQARGPQRASGAGNGRWIPAMDLTESEDQFVLRADLPGLTKDDVEIQVKDDVLTVSGERKSRQQDQGEGYYRVERSFGRFSRSLELPGGVDASAVSADFENGVLEVRIPKPEQQQPTRIEIGSSNGNGTDGDGEPASSEE
jgi:HSP20 family protein